MQRHVTHLASLLLLLASLSSAEAANRRDASPVFAAPYVRVLMAQQRAAKAASLSVVPSDDEVKPSLDLSAASRDAIETVWTMRDAVSAVIDLHEVTGSGL